MKKTFCILSLVFAALSLIFGMVVISMTAVDLFKKLAASKDNTMEKIKFYIADKLEVVKVEADDVVIKTENSLES